MRPLALPLLALAAASAPAQDYAVGVGFGTSPLFTYSVQASGDIAFIDQTAQVTAGELVRVDADGRFVLTFRTPNDLDIWRVEGSGVLSHAASFDWGGESVRPAQDLSLSGDSRLDFTFLIDESDPEEDQFFSASIVINNRLELVEGETEVVHLGEDLAPVVWAISGQGPDDGYTIPMTLVSREMAVFSMSATGEIADTGQRIATPGLLNLPLQVSDDGRWVMGGGSFEANVALFEVSDDGTVTLADFADYTDTLGPNVVRFSPQGPIVIGGAGFDLGVATVEFDAETLLGPVIDAEAAGLEIPEAMAVSADGSLILLDDQSGGGEFSLYSYFLASDGQLTPTGFSLAKNFKLADLQFIPPRTPPSLPGDANTDGRVDAADVVFVINEALPDDRPILLPQAFANADLDGDVDVDVEDLEALVGMLLGG